jgi:hypothetical protein
MRVPSHVHIRGNNKKVDFRRKLRNVGVRYITTWRLMAKSPFAFPIAVGLYPMTLVTEVTRMIAKGVSSLKARTDSPQKTKH